MFWVCLWRSNLCIPWELGTVCQIHVLAWKVWDLLHPESRLLIEDVSIQHVAVVIQLIRSELSLRLLSGPVNIEQIPQIVEHQKGLLRKFSWGAMLNLNDTDLWGYLPNAIKQNSNCIQESSGSIQNILRSRPHQKYVIYHVDVLSCQRLLSYMLCRTRRYLLYIKVR